MVRRYDMRVIVLVSSNAPIQAYTTPLMLRSGIACCTSTSSAPSTTLANSTRKPSPVVLVRRARPGDAPLVLGDLRIEKLAAQRFEAFEHAFLVPPPSAASTPPHRRRGSRRAGGTGSLPFAGRPPQAQ